MNMQYWVPSRCAILIPTGWIQDFVIRGGGGGGGFGQWEKHENCEVWNVQDAIFRVLGRALGYILDKHEPVKYGGPTKKLNPPRPAPVPARQIMQCFYS